MDIFDYLYRNEYLDIADEVISVPKKEDIRVTDPEIYMQRLAHMTTPRERLMEFIRSIFDADSDTHEAVGVRRMATYGLAFGWLFGGIIRNRHAFEDFRRKHNASLFDNQHKARRLYIDSYVYSTLTRGAKYGIGTALFCSTAGLIGYGSIVYRNKVYLPDWLLGFGSLGAISRCWLGLRGTIFGAGMGILAGTFGYTFAKSVEIFSGQSVSQIRYLHHVEYLEKRQAKLDRLHRIRAQKDKEMAAKA